MSMIHLTESLTHYGLFERTNGSLVCAMLKHLYEGYDIGPSRIDLEGCDVIVVDRDFSRGNLNFS